MENLKNKAYHLLRKSESIFKTDMVYLAKGGFWLTLGQIISSSSSFALSVAFANLLLPETYGIYRYILSISVLLTIPAMGGIDTALIQAAARGYEGSLSVSFKTKFKYGTLGALCSVIISAYYFAHHNSDLGISFLIAGTFIPLMEATTLYDAVLQGKKNFKTSSIFSSISQIISAIFLLITLFFTREVILLVIAYFFSWTLCRVIFFQTVKSKTSLNLKVDESVITYGKHLTAMGILSTISNYIDRFLVFHFAGAVELAMYSIAIAAPEQMKAVFKGIQTLALPKFSQRSPNEVRKTLVSKMIIYSLIVGLSVIVYIIAAPYLFELFFPRYVNAVIYSQIFSVSLVTTSASMAITAMQAHKSQAELYKFNLWTSAIQIIFLIIGIITLGLLGIILARVITRFFVLILSLKLYKSVTIVDEKEIAI